MAILVNKLGKEEKKRQNPFPAILWLKQGKDPTDIELGGGEGVRP